MTEPRAVRLVSPFAAEPLLFAGMVATEELGRPFRLEVEMLSENDALDLDAGLGQPLAVALDLPEDETRWFHGHVSRLALAGLSGRYTVYRATVRPWLWFLTQTADNRIFQNLSVPEIVKSLFREHGYTDFEEALSGDYQAHEYCVQYRETDFNFVSRLLEQEGIYYYFRHEADKHTLVLADDSSAHSSFPGYDEIPYFPPSEKEAEDRDHVFDWSVARELQPGSYTLTDFDFERPRVPLLVRSAIGDERAAAREIYDQPGQYADAAIGQRYARTRLQELQCRYRTAEASGNARGIAAGSLFSMTGHPADVHNREYLTVAARHELRANAYESGTGADLPTYTCHLTAIPGDEQFRPARATPKPIAQGPQTATVVGKDGEKIWVDEYGRVKVQFHWDREGKSDENSSCWVRVSQNWAGQNWGGMFIPHIGQEVIVTFLEGDPDRPIITGRVYNAEQMPPLDLPDNKHKSIIRDDYGNELIFDATPGDEHIRLYSPHHNSSAHIGRSYKTSTYSDTDTYTVGNTTQSTFGSAAGMTVGSNHAATFGIATSLFVGGQIGLTIGVGITATIAAQMELTLGAKISLEFSAKYAYAKGVEVSEGDETWTQTRKKAIKIDSDEKFELYGGKSNNAKIEGKTESLILDFGSDQKPQLESPQKYAILSAVTGLVSLGLAGAGALAGPGASLGAEQQDMGGRSQAGEREYMTDAQRRVEELLHKALSRLETAVKVSNARIPPPPPAPPSTTSWSTRSGTQGLIDEASDAIQRYKDNVPASDWVSPPSKPAHSMPTASADNAAMTDDDLALELRNAIDDVRLKLVDWDKARTDLKMYDTSAKGDLFDISDPSKSPQTTYTSVAAWGLAGIGALASLSLLGVSLYKWWKAKAEATKLAQQARTTYTKIALNQKTIVIDQGKGTAFVALQDNAFVFSQNDVNVIADKKLVLTSGADCIVQSKRLLLKPSALEMKYFKVEGVPAPPPIPPRPPRVP